MGIPSSQIENTGLCSFTKGDQFFSARREGIETGRMVSGIMICR
jgi:polyphenol oxidase